MVVGFGGAVTVTIVAPRNCKKMVAVFGVQNTVVAAPICFCRFSESHGRVDQIVFSAPG